MLQQNYKRTPVWIHIRHQSSIINCYLPSSTMQLSSLWCFTWVFTAAFLSESTSNVYTCIVCTKMEPGTSKAVIEEQQQQQHPHSIFRKLPFDNFPHSAFRKIPLPFIQWPAWPVRQCVGTQQTDGRQTRGQIQVLVQPLHFANARQLIRNSTSTTKQQQHNINKNNTHTK